MLRVVLALCLPLGLAACSVGQITLPFAQPTAVTQAASTQGSGRTATTIGARRTALGGPQSPDRAVGGLAGAGDFGDPGALDLINELRHGKGLAPLTVDPALTRAAQMQASHIARTGSLTHLGPDGSTPLDRARLAGYQPALAAENVAGGQESVIDAIRSWRESDSHLRNMMLPDATHMGIAQLTDPKSGMRTYWVLVLAAPRRG